MTWLLCGQLCVHHKFKVRIGREVPHCRAVLQNWQDKTTKASPKNGSIIEHLPRLLQDTKSLRSCYRNQEKMFLKYHFGIKYTTNMTRSSDSFSTVLSIVDGGDWGCIVCDLETISIVLETISIDLVTLSILLETIIVTE